MNSEKATNSYEVKKTNSAWGRYKAKFKSLSTTGKILDVLFKCTFLPYIVSILIVLIIGCITGANFFGYIEPGFEAIQVGFLIVCAYFIFIPIIPICFIIQMAVLIRKLVIKNRAKSGKKTGIAPFVIGSVVVAVLFIGGMYAIVFKYEILELFDKQRAQLFYNKSEQVIPYDKWIECSDVFNDSRFNNYTMMVDWDSYTLGFVFEDPSAEFEEVKLEKTTQTELDSWFEGATSEREQLTFTFSNGNVLTTYTDSPKDCNYQDTILFLVETPDGELYSSSNIGLYYYLQENSFTYGSDVLD